MGGRRSAAIFCIEIELPSARGISSRRPRGDTLSNYAFESCSCLNNSYCHLDQSALSCYITVNCSNHCSINLLSVSAYQVNLIRRKYSGGCFVTLFLPLASLSLVRELLVDVFRFFNTAGCVHIQPDNRMYNCLYRSVVQTADKCKHRLTGYRSLPVGAREQQRPASYIAIRDTRIEL